MLTLVTHRPRNVDAPRAAALLYGDWGTSKAYVIGLGLAIAGYSSFWLILGLSALSLLVGSSYTLVCKCFPDGGGVYASVRRRSKVVSVVGALFLFADYLVTASLSALSAAFYFQLQTPVIHAALFVCLIGLINYFGPRHTGTIGYCITLLAVTVFTLLALLSLPFLAQAWHNLTPLTGTLPSIWTQFCSLIVALSGVEAIANATGVMKLDRGASRKNPRVARTATIALVTVMIEVIVYTALFALAAAAISGFEFTHDQVLAPDTGVDVRDYMLRYVGITFGTTLFGHTFGVASGVILSIAIGLLLLSAVNTSINGLCSLQYLMSADEELPKLFRRVNRFGMPLVPLALGTVIPALLILLFKNVAALASLYAVGFVGAIALNLASTSTDRGLPLSRLQRGFLFTVFLIMGSIELTLFYDKPQALFFLLCVVTAGMVLWGMAKWLKVEEPPLRITGEIPQEELFQEGALLCVVSHVSQTLKTALARAAGGPINILFVKVQKVISEQDLKKTGRTDPALLHVVAFAKGTEKVRFHYCVTDSYPDIVAAYALRLDAKEIYIEPSKRRSRQLSHLLPQDVRVVS